MRMSFGDTPTDKQEMIDFLHAAVERGVTFFDTAEVYGPFTNEELVGEALEPFKGQGGDRHQIWVETRSEKGPHPSLGVDSRPEQIKRVAEASLKRLRVEAIDLFYQHRPDPNVPMEDVAGAVKDLIQAGKVKHFGFLKQTQSRSAAPMPCSRSLPCRANIRSGGGTLKNPAHSGGTRDWSCALQPAGPRLPDRQDRRDHNLRQHRYPQPQPAL